MQPDSHNSESGGVGCAVAKYFILLLSLVPLSPFLLHNRVQYSVTDLVGTVVMLVSSPVIALIEGFMLVLLSKNKIDLILFSVGTSLAASPILMFWANWIYSRSQGH